MFLIFNRPELTQAVFSRIREIKPKFLFVAADGPRKGNYADAISCGLTRDIINQVDWECELKLLYREENLGCGKAVSGAITWFFGQVEKGIILEDDCLPRHSFFRFCEEMLDRYASDEHVFHIGGVNFQNGIQRGNGSYYFSAIPHIWGWATWRRAWAKYDFNTRDFGLFNRNDRIKQYYDHPAITGFWLKTFQAMHRHAIDTWDHQWTFAILNNAALSITPNVNMVSNIGFGADATHTTAVNQYADVAAKDIRFPLRHPNEISQDKAADLYFYKEVEKLAGDSPPGFFQTLHGSVISTLEDFLRTSVLPKVQRRTSKNILLVKPDAIGDMFICQWLFNYLGQHPDAKDHKFYLLANIRLKSYLDAAQLPFIAEVIYYDQKIHQHFKPLYGFYFRLRKYRFAKVYNLLYSRTKLTDEIVEYTGAPFKAGFEGDLANIKPADKVITDRYYTSLFTIENDEQRILHESERIKLFFEQMLGTSLNGFSEAYLKPLAAQSRTVLICPGSNEDYKKWSPLNYANLITALQETNPGFIFRVMCGPGEERLGAAIKAACPSAETEQVSDIHRLIALVNEAALVVSNDSAPVHIAIAYG
ncbi:MAG: glycosyltransferase family 9 protein, partial [Bacteroidia bacterium]